MFNQTKNHHLQTGSGNSGRAMQLMMFWLMFMSLTLMVYAAPGTLDTSFGTNGIVLRNISTSNDEIKAVAVQPDNKIVAVGYSGQTTVFTVARFNTNGTPDTSFGNNGVVLTPFSLPNSIAISDSYAYTAAIQSDGKIVVAGDVGPYQGFALARYTSAGALDTSFDVDGQVVTTTQNLAVISQIALQSDGKIVAVGWTADGDFAVARYTTGGALDSTFGGGDGIVITDFEGGYDAATSVKLQSNGKIIVGGSAENEDLKPTFALARYNTDGSPDTTFNGTGLKTIFTPCGPDSPGCGAEALGLQSDGKIVVAGSNDDVYMARLNPDGSQINGVTATNIGGSSEYARSLAIDLNDKILVAGSTISNGNEDFFIVRFQSNGLLDSSFDNGDGIVVTPLGSNSDIGYSVAIQPNGGIIVGGSKGDFGSKEFGLVRYLGLAPTAANAAISGRIVSAGGSGIGNVRVGLTNHQGTTIYAITNPFGYYNFYDLPVGELYILTPNSTRYTFNPTSLTVSLQEDFTSANFTAL